MSIDRRQSVAEAMDTVMLAEQYSKSEEAEVRVVGVDLSGDPHVRSNDATPMNLPHGDPTLTGRQHEGSTACAQNGQGEALETCTAPVRSKYSHT